MSTLTHTVEPALHRSRRSFDDVARGALRRSLLPGIVFVCVLAIWQTAAATGLERARILPSPGAVVAALVAGWGPISVNVPTTLRTALTGYAVGAGLAILIATLFSVWAPALNQVVRAAIVLETVPALALTPIVVIVAPGPAAGSILSGLGVFFVVLMGTVAGLSETTPQMLEVHRASGGGPIRAVFQIRLWAALPTIFSSLMIAAPVAILGTIMTEFLVVGTGLGSMLLASYESLDTARVWALSLICALATTALFGAIALIRNLTVPWARARGVEYRPPRGNPRPWPWRVSAGLVTTVVSVIVVLGLWSAAIVAFRLNHFFAKTPMDVFRYLVLAPGAAANRNEILSYLLPTFVKGILGLAGGTLLAIACAWIIASSERIERALMPLLVTTRAIPFLTLIPAIMLIVRNGYLAAVVLTGITTFFVTLTALVQAAKFTPQEMLLLGRSYSIGTFARLRLITAPSVIPAFFAALKITVPSSITAAMTAEWLLTGDGIGRLMILGGMESRYSTLWASFTAMSLTSLTLFAVVVIAERLVMRRMV